MKIFAWVAKYLLAPMSTILGLIYGFHMYVVSTSEAVVKPTEVKVSGIKEDVEEIKLRTRNIEQILMEKRR